MAVKVGIRIIPISKSNDPTMTSVTTGHICIKLLERLAISPCGTNKIRHFILDNKHHMTQQATKQYVFVSGGSQSFGLAIAENRLDFME